MSNLDSTSCINTYFISKNKKSDTVTDVQVYQHKGIRLKFDVIYLKVKYKYYWNANWKGYNKEKNVPQIKYL